MNERGRVRKYEAPDRPRDERQGELDEPLREHHGREHARERA
jgi:hypothetical protein